MKIYNEVISRFNDTTGQWETISEDSFEYNGPLELAQGVPPNSAPINAELIVIIAKPAVAVTSSSL